ncbi:hypothetical protein MA16_Dca028758 [Dendrobium catenatum]|uniref:Uncharacterized protein n=1 Tax=Dendrobium catenatum TaxID=906689 RepID=A0A2I0VHS6_9ASPA|nr:hypothetical protein MA16_Dca028758 [Dendrobium catenatum]
MDSPVGIPLSGNPQNPPPPVLPSPSTNGNPLSQNSQSSENPTNPPALCNGPPAIFTAEEMHELMAATPFDYAFFGYMRVGRCREAGTTSMVGLRVCTVLSTMARTLSAACGWLASSGTACLKTMITINPFFHILGGEPTGNRGVDLAFFLNLDRSVSLFLSRIILSSWEQKSLLLLESEKLRFLNDNNFVRCKFVSVLKISIDVGSSSNLCLILSLNDC